MKISEQVETINKVLNTMLQCMIGVHKSYWKLLLYATLWAYQTSIRNFTGFTPFQLVYGLELILPIECEIPLLKLAIELLPTTSAKEERILHLTHLDETWCDVVLANEAHKICIKVKYDKSVKPRVFLERDLFILYDQEADNLGLGKF